MRERRGSHHDDAGLCSGPGKLTEALGVGLEHNEAPLDRDPFLLRGAGARLPARGRRRPADRDHQSDRASLALLRRRLALRLEALAALSWARG